MASAAGRRLPGTAVFYRFDRFAGQSFFLGFDGFPIGGFILYHRWQGRDRVNAKFSEVPGLVFRLQRNIGS